MDLVVAGKNAEDVRWVLDETGIPFWLMFGTFLGAYRDHAIIPYDGDIDFAIRAEDLSLFLTSPGAAKMFSGKGGFELRLQPIWVALHRGGQHVDIYLFRPRGKKRCWQAIQIDANAFNVYNEIDFLGEKWRILNEPERWLKYMYGANWRTPIKNKGIAGRPFGPEFEVRSDKDRIFQCRHCHRTFKEKAIPQGLEVLLVHGMCLTCFRGGEK